MTQNKELGPEYIHFNTLIWQLPTVGIAIATATLTAANKIAAAEEPMFELDAYTLELLVLFFGSIVLFIMSWTLARFRHFQSWVTPVPPPTPPFLIPPSSNWLLQGVMCILSGFIFGINLYRIYSRWEPLVLGVVSGLCYWYVIEEKHKEVLRDINKKNKSN